MKCVHAAAIAVVLVVLAAGRSAAQDSITGPVARPVLNNDQLLRKYVISTLGPSGALHATLASGLEQWRGAPDAWRTNGTGYAKRWVSEFAESAIGNTTKYSVARALHHDPSFTRCACTGVLPRLRHAAASPFLARTRDGRMIVSPATVAGLAAENIIPAATWYPAPNGTRDGVRHAISGIVSKIGVDVFREFVSFRFGSDKP